ncbi:MAG: tyrosine-type recombinase/integrase [Thermodesulfobacteriota bacterium]|nr:tyrosine-type recombinase/integrase [Thermodesulfobacteriota bacterium]
MSFSSTSLTAMPGHASDPFSGGVLLLSKRGNIRFDRKCQRYFIDLHWQGQRYRLYKYLGQVPCKDLDIATRFLNDIRSDIDKGIFNPNRYKKGKPFSLEVYWKAWLEGLPISEATRHDYENSLKNHICPILGHEFLADINYDKLRKLQTAINRKPKGKYNVMGCLHKLLEDAHRSGHIPQMPTFPGFKGTEAIVPPAIRYLEDPDQWRILKQIPMADRHIFVFLKLTGCRPSEARAFRKEDIREPEILFVKTFGRGEILKEVKSKRPRTFPLTEALKELFQGMPANLTPFLFVYSKTGKPYTKNLNRIWNRACDAAGVKRVPLYCSTRHSFGCQCLNAGLDKAMVQRLLGHTDDKMTDRYAEYSTSALKIALDNIQRLPRRGKGQQVGSDEK